ncbi:hypothetical protein ACHAWF_006059 [Thalassiosira exigua]
MAAALLVLFVVVLSPPGGAEAFSPVPKSATTTTTAAAVAASRARGAVPEGRAASEAEAARGGGGRLPEPRGVRRLDDARSSALPSLLRRASSSSSSSLSSSTALRASLRELLESSDSAEGGSDEGRDGEGDSPSSSSSPRRSRDSTPDDSNENFRRLVNYSRSKFVETKFRTRSAYGTGSDDDSDAEGWLLQDRYAPFSFATSKKGARSGSEGGSSAATASGARGEDVGTLDDDVEADEVAEEANEGGEGDEEKADGEKGGGAGYGYDYDDYSMVADDPYDMVGVSYSRRKFPVRESRGTNNDEDDQLGLHSDRLSTFSFSERGTPPERIRTAGTEADPGANVASGAGGASGGGEAASKKAKPNPEDIPFAVDDHLGNINLATNRLASFAESTRRKSVPDGLDDHGDRLSTFSLSAANEAKKSMPSVGSRGGDAEADGDDEEEEGRTTREEEANHDDRLGTFSFASTDPRSGSAPSRGASSASSLFDPSDGVKPPGSSGATVSGEDVSFECPPNEAKLLDRRPRPVGGGSSLASLASSVSTKTRNDRIREVRKRTDPKLLHPDGMNVPRLNARGDVMSFSGSSGRPNIFQRIEEANQGAEGVEGEEEEENESEGAADEVSDDDVEGSAEGENEGDDDGDAAVEGKNKSVAGARDRYVGFDLGTSGARLSVVERAAAGPSSGGRAYSEAYAASLKWDDELRYDDPASWRAAIDALLSRAAGESEDSLSRVRAMCVSGTSATCLLVERGGLGVSRGARMYDYDVSASSSVEAAKRAAELIDEYVPERHTARANTGSLAKLLLWNEEEGLVDDEGNAKEVLCHQSDYVAMSLMREGLDDGECVVASDWHNCLKLGYDVRERKFPEWMRALLKEGAGVPDPSSVLPSRVVSPGEPLGTISPAVASRFGLPSDVVVVGGTTDSNAAFFAAAGAEPAYGTAVTSLGSTLAIKQLSRTFVEDASRGVYSHRFPRFGGGDGDGEDEGGEEEEAWLIGGASNVGCAVLREEGFSDEELRALSEEIDPDSDSPLSYYPLTKRGERFPVADGTKEPVLDPKPESRGEYLRGILQGIGDVERDGYRALGELGADPKWPTAVLSCGGGAKNDAWIAMRERRLRDVAGEGAAVRVTRAANTEASYGAALLAAASFEE